jgi:hypothetical protein
VKDIEEEALLPSDWTTPICYHKEKENERYMPLLRKEFIVNPHDSFL